MKNLRLKKTNLRFYFILASKSNLNLTWCGDEYDVWFVLKFSDEYFAMAHGPSFPDDPFPYVNMSLNKFIKYNCGILLGILLVRIRARPAHVNALNNGDITMVDSGKASEAVFYVSIYFGTCYAYSVIKFDGI